MQEDDDRWLVYAGDADFRHGELLASAASVPPGLSAYQRLTQFDIGACMTDPRCVWGLSIDHDNTVRPFALTI